MDPFIRIIDANANRAREALRVMEDAARFGLDDAVLSEQAKSLRHDLMDGIQGLGLEQAVLLAHRDTPGDVGTQISTQREAARADLAEVVGAAAGRLAEALRSIEESAKGLGKDGTAFEALRYRAYTFQKDLTFALTAHRCPQWRLCVVLTNSLCTRHSWQEVARLAIRGGADCLQLREKDLSDSEFFARARELIEIATASQSRPAVIINDRPDIAVLVGAAGVHLGQDDLPTRAVRKLSGKPLLIGRSTANLDQARQAIRDGADYCGVGAMFATTTKEKPRISGPEYLNAYLGDEKMAATPHLAIGGIDASNIGTLKDAGCRGVAVSSAICAASDPEKVARVIVDSLS